MSVRISIEPSERPEARESASLGQQISRITQERGSFADLTEAQLEAQIAGDGADERMDVDVDVAAAAPPADAAAAPDADAGAADAGDAGKSFDELRAELAGRVATALNESALNLDFLSLLVSVSRPQAGISSMSPMLKSQIPPGTLNADTVETPVPSVPSESAYGWKVSAYKRAAEHLNFASSRLKQETRKEATFWQDLLRTTRSGEVVNRKMNVRYGYGDSGSSYFNRGWGRLVSDDESGHVVFVPSQELADQLVRVSIFADNKPGQLADETPEQTPEPERLVGRAVLHCAATDLSRVPEPVRSIKSERDRLFEHELMYQLIQESRRDLAPHKVRLTEGKIVCELFDGRIEIDLVDAAESSDVVGDKQGPATAICYCLHLLLTEHFRTVLKRKQQPPAPLSSARHEPAPPPSILKPTLAHIHLSILVSRTVRLIQLMLPDAKSDVSDVDAPSLDAVPHCTIKTQHAGRELELRLGSPLYAAEEPVFQVKALGSEPQSASFYDLTELELWLKWVTK